MTTTTMAAPSTAIEPRQQPSQSLYVQNLVEKFQKHDLKRNLYMLFSSYGPVLDVTVVKTRQMRGQAHVLFRDVQSATQAMRHCQGFEFFGREMKISYAKSRSHTLAKLTGTFDGPATGQPKAAATGGVAQPPSGFPAPPGMLPAGLTAPAPANGGPENSASPAGTKRLREESEEEEGDGKEDTDEDSGGEMEMSDDEE